MSPSHAIDPSRLVLHLTVDPCSIVDLSSISIAFIELKSAADFVVGFHGGCGWLFLVGRGGGSVYGVFIVVRYCSEMKYFNVVDILFYCDLLC